MPDDYSLDPADTGRPRGVVSKRDRKYLTGESDVPPQSSHERRIRSEIRERLYHSILDFAFLAEHLEERDRSQVFGELGTPPEEPSDEMPVAEALSSIALADGFESLLRLFYEELRDAEAPWRFGDYLERAIVRVEMGRAAGDGDHDSLRVVGEPTVDFDVTPPETIDPEALAERIEQYGWQYLDRGEAMYVVMATVVAAPDLPTDSPLVKLASLIYSEYQLEIPLEQLHEDGERLAGPLRESAPPARIPDDWLVGGAEDQDPDADPED